MTGSCARCRSRTRTWASGSRPTTCCPAWPLAWTDRRTSPPPPGSASRTHGRPAASATPTCATCSRSRACSTSRPPSAEQIVIALLLSHQPLQHTCFERALAASAGEDQRPPRLVVRHLLNLVPARRSPQLDLALIAPGHRVRNLVLRCSPETSLNHILHRVPVAAADSSFLRPCHQIG